MFIRSLCRGTWVSACTDDLVLTPLYMWIIQSNCACSRTGLVVIPLMAALFDIPVTETSAYVNASTAQLRESDRHYPGHLPETAAQESMTQQVESFVRKHKR